MNFFDTLNDYIRQIENSLVNLLSAIAPWGAPLAPAYMSYWGMINHLKFDWVIAIILAGVIEILGLSTVHTTVTFWQYNRRRMAEYKKAPTLVPAAMFLLYLLTVLTMDVMLEWPNTWEYKVIIARTLLGILTVPAAVTLAVRALHTEMLTETVRKVSETPKNFSGNFPKVSETFRTDFRNLPNEDRQLISNMTIPQIMDRYQVSDRTARNWKKNVVSRESVLDSE